MYTYICTHTSIYMYIPMWKYRGIQLLSDNDKIHGNEGLDSTSAL